jgi:D-amino-acid dehydrogenase
LSKRVLVVGSGVVGLSVALECLRRGFAVTLVDRERKDRRSCSFGNAGMIVPSHFVPLAAPGAMLQGLKWMLDPVAPFRIVPRPSWDLLAWLVRFARAATSAQVDRAAPLLRDLCLASRSAYEELAARGCDFGLVKEGLLVVCRTAHAWQEEMRIADRARELGLAADAYSGHDAQGIEPSLRADVAGAVHYPVDCHLTPDRLMACLEREVANGGGAFLFDTEVVGWRTDASRRRVLAARTRSGNDIDADEFVLCAGAWSPHVARDLGLALPMQAGKGYSLTLPAFDRKPRHCAILAEARVAVTPMGAGLRVGGTMELAGLDRSINAPRVRAIVDAVPRYYDGIAAQDFAGVEPWSGLRPCTPDGLAYVGRTRRQSNVVVAAGHAMMGVTLAPATAKIVGSILAGEPSPFDLALLSPDRY